MAGAQPVVSYRDLEAWQLAMDLADQVYDLTALEQKIERARQQR